MSERLSALQSVERKGMETVKGHLASACGRWRDGRLGAPEYLPVVFVFNLLPAALLHDLEGYAVLHGGPEPDSPAPTGLSLLPRRHSTEASGERAKRSSIHPAGDAPLAPPTKQANFRRSLRSRNEAKARIWVPCAGQEGLAEVRERIFCSVPSGFQFVRAIPRLQGGRCASQGLDMLSGV